MTNDGRWVFTWDGENRLVSLQGLSGIPTGAKFKVDFVYDPQGRRIQKLVSTNNGSLYYPLSTNRFLYDGWNLVASVNPASSLVQSFLWGLDLSGSPQGAGGVGGLVAIDAPSTGVQFMAMDGNGNVAALVKATDGTIAATYEYGPFGEVIRSTGTMAKSNPFRFSSKFQDDETDLLYYGYRYLNTSTGRWLSRDPIQERGGWNLFGFVENNALLHYDALGLEYEVFSTTGGEPNVPLLPRRHHSYLTFHMTCPAGTKYRFHHVDYSGVAAGLLAAGFSQEDINRAIAEHGGLGGDASDRFPPKTPNCYGEAVSANVYMETRFVNPAPPIPGDGAAFPPGPGEPDRQKAKDAYVSGTTLYYQCLDCCKRFPDIQVW
jgi:RHS repeat-associated protein